MIIQNNKKYRINIIIYLCTPSCGWCGCGVPIRSKPGNLLGIEYCCNIPTLLQKCSACYKRKYIDINKIRTNIIILLATN